MNRRWWLLLKLAVSVGLVAVIGFRVDRDALKEALSGMGLEASLLAVLLTLASALVSTWRWHRVLAYLGTKVSVWTLLGDTLVGSTYNMLLPTSVGGDVARSLRLASRSSSQEVAWASVAFERIVGLLALLLVSVLGLGYSLSAATRPLLGVALTMGLALVSLLLLAPRSLALAGRSCRRYSARLGDFLESLGQTFAGPLARVWPRCETLGWSLAYQLVALSILLAPAAGWHEPRLLEAIYLGVPVALVGAMAPVTLGGLGLRESLFVVVLEPFGIDASKAMALAIVWLGSSLLLAIFGLFVILCTRR